MKKSLRKLIDASEQENWNENVAVGSPVTGVQKPPGPFAPYSNIQDAVNNFQ